MNILRSYMCKYKKYISMYFLSLFELNEQQREEYTV